MIQLSHLPSEILYMYIYCAIAIFLRVYGQSVPSIFIHIYTIPMSTGRSAFIVLIGWTNPFFLERVIFGYGILRASIWSQFFQLCGTSGSWGSWDRKPHLSHLIMPKPGAEDNVATRWDHLTVSRPCEILALDFWFPLHLIDIRTLAAI